MNMVIAPATNSNANMPPIETPAIPPVDRLLLDFGDLYDAGNVLPGICVEAGAVTPVELEIMLKAMLVLEDGPDDDTVVELVLVMELVGEIVDTTSPLPLSTTPVLLLQQKGPCRSRSYHLGTD